MVISGVISGDFGDFWESCYRLVGRRKSPKLISYFADFTNSWPVHIVFIFKSPHCHSL